MIRLSSSDKYKMNYKLYTLVDITYTGQFYLYSGREEEYYKQQNFNTVIQTLGLRSNIYYENLPYLLEVNGSIVGFDTEDIIRVWRFDFSSEHDRVYEHNGDPVWYLKESFHLVPYIQGLSELMTQTYAVFVSNGEGKNIVFHKK